MPSGGGRADGGAFGPVRGGGDPRRSGAALTPTFDLPLAPGGYAWWYLDALSDCGRYGLTLIAFLGSVFSPYYAWAGRRRPLNHAAVNVALYGPRAARWAMTERGEAAVARSGDALVIGPSSLRWDGEVAVFTLDERCAPIPRRIAGEVRVHPSALTGATLPLDACGRHRWSPLAPRARVEVAMTRPGLRWVGDGYFDANDGDEPLEAGFRQWDWSRAHLSRGRAAILYHGVLKDGGRFAHALEVGPDGAVKAADPPPPAPLPRTLWRLKRETCADPGAAPRVLRTFEDSPFYARATLSTRLFGQDAVAVHETLSLDRFEQPWVKWMLPFRMPRALR